MYKWFKSCNNTISLWLPFDSVTFAYGKSDSTEAYSEFFLLKAKENAFMCFLRNLNVESGLVWKKGLEAGKRRVFSREIRLVSL